LLEHGIPGHGLLLDFYGTIVADLARAARILLLLTVRARTAEVLIEDAILKCPLRR
jgi:hypothetical protein